MGTSLSSFQEQFVVCTCLQDTRNIFFDPEFEANLVKQLPQILPPLPSASLASLLHPSSHSDQPDELKALPPQATEIDNHPSMDTTGACAETGVISAPPVIEGAAEAQRDVPAVFASCELFPAQGIHKLQSSNQDNGMDSLSAPCLNDCKALIKDSFPPAEGLTCLPEWQDLAFKQTKINAGASPDGPLMFMEGAAFSTAVQQGFTTTALTQAAEVSINAFQSANQTACLTPFLAGLKESAATSVSPPVQPKLHYVPANWDPGPDFFDIMDWGTKQLYKH